LGQYGSNYASNYDVQTAAGSYGAQSKPSIPFVAMLQPLVPQTRKPDEIHTLEIEPKFRVHEKPKSLLAIPKITVLDPKTFVTKFKTRVIDSRLTFDSIIKIQPEFFVIDAETIAEIAQIARAARIAKLAEESKGDSNESQED
jgi:hypothetical protein